MSVTTSQQMNSGTFFAQFPGPVSVEITGGLFETTDPKTISSGELTDQQIQKAVDAAADLYIAAAAAQTTLLEKARDALVTNKTFLDIQAPTAAQATAQVKALTRQVNALIRLVVGDLRSTDDT